MIRKILFSLTLALVSLSCFAQWEIGLRGGIVDNELETNPGYYYSRQYNNDAGFTVAIPIQYRFNSWFALRADLGYIEKNYIWERKAPEIQESGDAQNRYIQLPIMGNFSFGGEKLRGFLNFGAFCGILANSSRGVNAFSLFSGEYVYSQDKNSYNPDRDNRYELGIIGGIGIEYLISSKLKCFIESNIQYSLSDLQKSSYMPTSKYPMYNTCIVAQIGVSYIINFKSKSND